MAVLEITRTKVSQGMALVLLVIAGQLGLSSRSLALVPAVPLVNVTDRVLKEPEEPWRSKYLQSALPKETRMVTTELDPLAPVYDRTLANISLAVQARTKANDESSLRHCGCPESCDFWTLRHKSSGSPICEERIEFMQRKYKTPRLEACAAAVNQGHCSASCHPEKCAPVPLSLEEQFPTRPDPRIQRHISYQLDKNAHYDLSYDGQACPEDRPPLPFTLNGAGQLDFTTLLSTNLRVMFMGDSVGAYQMGQNFIEAAGGLHNVTQIAGGLPYPNNQLWAAPTTGGGVAIAYRANAQMLSNGLLRNGPLGVSAHHVLGLKNYLYQHSHSSDVDVVVLTIPAGWIGKEDAIVQAVTTEALAESVRLAGELFGAKIVILSTVHLNNNIFQIQKNLLPMNQRIFEFAARYRQEIRQNPDNQLGGVEDVVVLDFGQYTLNLAFANAVSIGLLKGHNQTTTSDFAALDQVLNNGDNQMVLVSKNGKTVHRPVALICAEKTVSLNATDCMRNSLYTDGMHLCLKNVGGRLHAGSACLISCVISSSTVATVDSCERACNKRYMSILPVDFEEASVVNVDSM